MDKKLIRRGEYEIVEVKSFEESLNYVGDYGICWLKKESKYDYYKDKGKGKILLCLREGYKDLVRPKANQKMDKFDEYASSVIGVCLKEDGSVKAINSRYLWRAGGTDHDYTEAELMFLLGDKKKEVFSWVK